MVAFETSVTHSLNDSVCYKEAEGGGVWIRWVTPCMQMQVLRLMCENFGPKFPPRGFGSSVYLFLMVLDVMWSSWIIFSINLYLNNKRLYPALRQ